MPICFIRNQNIIRIQIKPFYGQNRCRAFANTWRLVYYKNTLGGYYRSKKEKGKFVDVTDRIFFDIIFCINNIKDYAKHHKATYNQAQNVVKVDGGEEIIDNSKVLVVNRAIKLKESEQLQKEVDQVKRLLAMTEEDWGE